MKHFAMHRMIYPLPVDDPRKRIKDRDYNWEGAAAQLIDVLVRIKTDITAVKEVRWTGQERKQVGSCDIYYSDHIKERKFGVGFVVGERHRRQVLAFTLVDELLATMRNEANILLDDF